MQTERVTFLTTPDHKAALDAFAANSGMSMGHVVREATTRYIADGAKDEEADVKAAAIEEVERALPEMQQDLLDIRASIAAARAAIAVALADPTSARSGLAA